MSNPTDRFHTQPTTKRSAAYGLTYPYPTQEERRQRDWDRTLEQGDSYLNFMYRPNYNTVLTVDEPVSGLTNPLDNRATTTMRGRAPATNVRAVAPPSGDAEQTYNSDPGLADATRAQRSSHYSFELSNGFPSRYYLELHDDPKKDPIDSVMLPHVNNLVMSQPLAVARTWVFEGAPYEEHSGFQQRMFTISGRSGYTAQDLSRFAKFRNFLEKYSQLSAHNKNAFVRGADIRLAINFPWEGESFWCTLMSFGYVRSTNTSRVSYEYQIVLVTNGSASYRWDPANGLTYMNCGGDKCHELPGHWCQKRAAEVEDLMPADAYDSIAAYTGPYLDLSNMVRQRSSGMNRHLEDADYWMRIWQKCKKLYDTLYYAYQVLSDHRKGLVRVYVGYILRWSTDLRMQAELTMGVKAVRVDAQPSQPNEHQPSPPKPIVDRGRLVGTIMVSAGEDTAYDVAGRYLGDRNLWLQVVRLNNMIDARTKSDGSPLGAGDQLLVPRAAGLPDIGEAYGTSFLIRDGDLVTENDTDIVLVSGFDNFYQNLRHRLLTTRGENRPYPNFGLPRLVGTANTTDVPSQVLRNVKAQVLADHRVARLTELTLEESGDTLKVDFAIETAVEDKARQSFEYPL